MLVVGAGPAGLATAITLARVGVRCLVVDRLARRPDGPRATGLSAGAVERLRRWGLQSKAEAAALDVETTGLRVPSLARAGEGTPFEVGMLTREQARVVSPARALCVGQDVVEALLEDHLRTLPAAEVRRGVVFVALRQDADGVAVRLRDADGGSAWTVRADYVVGADGVRGAVRAAVGIELDATTGLSDSLGARVRGPLWDLVAPERRHLIYAITDAIAGGALIPAGGDRWVYATERRPGVEATEASLVPLVRAAAGAADLPVALDELVELRYATALAQSFRCGRVLLAGDAAHRVTPRGATGLGMALVGGEALGWRLGWVLRGWAPPALLDGYEADRRPVAAHNVQRSASPDGSERAAHTEWRFDVGARLAHVWLDEATSTLDLVGPARTLVTGPAPGTWAAAAAAAPGAPVEVRSVPEDVARALGVGRRGALLLRPDGVPLGVWADDRHAASALAG